MDQGYAAGRVDPEAIAGTVKSVVQNHIENQQVRQQANGIRPNWAAYPAADLFGRCFLRVCLWVDVFTSWTRRGELLAYQGRMKASSVLPTVPVDGQSALVPAEMTIAVAGESAAASTPPS